MRRGCESFAAAIEVTIDLDCRLQANALIERGLCPFESLVTPFSQLINVYPLSSP
jgi:hypothetical protein